MCNKRKVNWSGEGLSGDKTVEVDDIREKERDVNKTMIKVQMLS